MFETDFFKKLQENFPKVYPKYPACGFYVNPGWEELLANLSKELAEHLEKFPEEFVVSQVKSKFGGLRFYTDTYSKDLQDIISRYEAESLLIDEMTGKRKETLETKKA